MSNTQLAVLRLDLPCQMPWDEMKPVGGDGSIRYCSQCALNVTDLSSMTTEEAEAFLARQAGERTCVSFLRDANAAVVTLDYQKIDHPRRRWPIVAAATMALAAGGAAAYHAASTPTFGRVAGGLRAMPATSFSPFNATTSAGSAPQAKLLPVQLRSDSSIQPLLAALPAGVEVLDLRYGVYPAALSANYGRCVVVGRADKPGASSGTNNLSNVVAVVWLMPPGYAAHSHLSQTAEPHPLRYVGSCGVGDILMWSEDAELERTILAGLLAEHPTITTTAPSDTRDE